MDIDALHTALLALSALPEKIASARAELTLGCTQPSPSASDYLRTLERDLRVAKVALARELGFGHCPYCWPPELLHTDDNGHAYFPAATQAKPGKPRCDSFAGKQKEGFPGRGGLVVDSFGRG